MKKIVLSSVILFASTLGWAETVPKADNEITGNANIITDYRYRGISQTRLKPAVQGGADYTDNTNGLYLGTWASTIEWIKDTPNAGNTPLEWDIYAGKKGEFSNGISYDIGVLQYLYPQNNLNRTGLNNANTFEVYGQAGYGPAYIKYSHALSTLFGIPDSKNSDYLDVSANIDLINDIVLNLHAGHQKIHGALKSEASYSDYKLGLTKTIKEASNLTVSAAFISTNANKVFYASPANGQFLGKSTFVISVGKMF